MAPQPAGNAPPQSPQVDAPDVAGTPPEPGDASIAEGAANAAAVAVPARPDAGAVVAAPAEQSSVAGLADTAPPPLPLTGADGTALAPPQEGAAPDAPTALQTTTPGTSTSPAAAPQIPAQDSTAVAATDSATPRPPPEPVDVASIAGDITAPQAPTATGAAPEVSVIEAAPAANSTPLAGVTPAPEAAPDTPPAVAVTTDPAPDAADAPGGLAPVADAAPAPEVTPADPAATDELIAQAPRPLAEPATVADAPSAPQDAPEPAGQAAPDTDAPDLIVPEGAGAALPRPVGNVRINRPTTVTDTPDDVLPEATFLPDLTDQPALGRHAAIFDNPAELPAMSVILIDTGALDGGPALLTGLPFPVSVAIDAGQPGAAELMRAYRAAGFEVLALARLPVGAQPTDVEVTLEAAFATLPEAIGLLDAGEGGLQANSAITTQAMARLANDGRGLVTEAQGLNMAVRAAADAGVPAGTIYRDLDSDGQDAATIRRFLDQAAFRARQDGGVILLARLRPDTLSALILWGGANRAGQVVLAPVSVLLGAADAAP